MPIKPKKGPEVKQKTENTPQMIALHKPLGIPSHRMAIELQERLGTVVTHTGNLDPMAEGVMVFLVGEDALKDQAEWQEANKEYEFEVLFGFSTDSYDQLGLAEDLVTYNNQPITDEKLKSYLKGITGSQTLQRPAYSYKVVKGKPLYWWARRGRLKEIKIPEVNVEIYRADLLGLESITKRALHGRIKKNISLVKGDFRQEAILKRWKEVLSKHPNLNFSVAKIRISSSKGTYVRSIAHNMGQALGIPSFVLSIVRTKNGPVTLLDCIQSPGISPKISQKTSPKTRMS